MCLERLEPRVEDFQEASRRQEWCDSVLSLKVPLETIIRKESAEGKELTGEKTENILIQCRFVYVFVVCLYVCFFVYLVLVSQCTDCAIFVAIYLINLVLS